ncbi:MAG: hypothetical protein KGY61_04250 [Desulfobacterales bacterium]|nr:hypothetical protein [Desulfobacterales bacterium]
MEKVNIHILIPNILIAFYFGRWLIKKQRKWVERIIVSTLPFLPVALLFFITATYTKISSPENLPSRIIGTWVSYLCLVWLWPLGAYAQQLDIRRLRKSAIKNIGWIAGNAAKVPSWQSYLGKESQYYKAIMGLNDNESQSNVDLYNRWWREGWKLAYNERKCRKKYHQTGKLIKKSKRYAKELKTVIIPGTPY